MPFGPAELREKAEECRALAAVAHAPEIREQLLEVADQFERLARHLAFVQMTAPPPKGSQALPGVACDPAGRHIRFMPCSYERLRAEIDATVEQYRAQSRSNVGKPGLTRAEAVKRIRQLGFTESDANRWLGPKADSKAPHSKWL